MIGKSNLEKLSDDDLKKVETWIAEIRDERKKEALSDITSNLMKAGYTKAELLAFLGGKPGVTKPKYRNPDNKSETWSGRGRRPKWFADQITAGKKPEDMMI